MTRQVGRPDERGMLWLVDDDPDQIRRFHLSYRTADAVAPHLSKAVATIGDPPLQVDDVAEVPLSTPRRGHAAKLDAWAASPFTTTLWLDNDTVVLRDPTEVLTDTGYVAALPYPDFFTAGHLDPTAADVPGRWRNVQSGVVCFHDRFLDHYGRVWDRFGGLVDRLPGYDQCLFSLALATAPEPWTPRLELQVTTSAYAVEFLAAVRGVNTGAEIPWFGDVPVPLFLGTVVFHYTAFKDFYEPRLIDSGLVDQVMSRWVRTPRWLDQLSYPASEVDPTRVPPPPGPLGPDRVRRGP